VSELQWISGLKPLTLTLTSPHSLHESLGWDRPVLLYGSRAQGVDDEVADIDLWAFYDPEELTAIDREIRTRFFNIKHAGVKGHITARDLSSFAQSVERCDLELIAQLQDAVVVSSGDASWGLSRLLDQASQPLTEAVRRAWFQYHYVAMRGADRSCDNPLFRGAAHGALVALSETLNHAMRAAIVLAGQPYRYHKWLHADLMAIPSGSIIGPGVERVFDLIERGDLRKKHANETPAIAVETKAIRNHLIETAKASGINEPWLDKWWYHIDASKQVIDGVKWGE